MTQIMKLQFVSLEWHLEVKIRDLIRTKKRQTWSKTTEAKDAWAKWLSFSAHLFSPLFILLFVCWFSSTVFVPLLLLFFFPGGMTLTMLALLLLVLALALLLSAVFKLNYIKDKTFVWHWSYRDLIIEIDISIVI